MAHTDLKWKPQPFKWIPNVLDIYSQCRALKWTRWESFRWIFESWIFQARGWPCHEAIEAYERIGKLESKLKQKHKPESRPDRFRHLDSYGTKMGQW